MRARHRIITWLTASYFATLGLLPASLNAGDFIKSVFKGPEVTTKEPCVERLAQEIDWLERHVEQYGSVVAKQPDVWGQARLTKHRDELEKQLFAQLNQFHVYLNGTLSRSDQAFLANAFALSASISGSQPAQPVNSQTVTTASAPTPTALPKTSDLIDTTPDFTTITKFEAGHFLTQDNGKIALEPEIALDQLNRYINHLQELRRINEGDDTADSPGYSLNLVRIPVSVLPGKATDQGYGAEITITATPYLNDGLLPITFRSLVINDLVDQLALPITKIADNTAWKQDPAKKVQLESVEAQLCEALREYAQALQGANEAESTAKANSPHESPSQVEQRILNAPIPTAAMTGASNVAQLRENFRQSNTDPESRSRAFRAYALSKQQEINNHQSQIATLRSQQASLRSTITAVVGPSSRTRNAQNPISPSGVVSVFGEEELLSVGKTFGEGYQGRDVRWNDSPKKIVHLPDVQRFLQSELEAAYQCLARPEYSSIWDSLVQGFGQALGDGGLATAIRRGDACEMKAIRDDFLVQFRAIGGALRPMGVVCTTCNEPTCLEALAWAILVESVLLDTHLKGDMKSIAQLRGCGCMESEHLRFYMPDPDVGERQAFQEYVRCRWPIHVFALDPVSQDQNIGDSALIRRDLQLAVSLAFVSGKMSASNFTKFVRQYEAQYETIALNRTCVGFSHGDDTFGWRFAPRFQTPPTQGNIAAFHQTLFGKHKDCDLLQRKIEPGMRECVAVVIMPSFVPYVTFDVRSNWYRLNHHHGWLTTRHEAEPSMSDTMKLSRAVKQMHSTAAHICDSGQYRDGDVALLMNRVKQLDRELPLQTMVAQVPIENTLGGFEMFSNGVTDLAPELYGWYGGPGILEKPGTSAACPSTTPAAFNGLGGVPVQSLPNVCPCATAGTTLFLVGDHFSVHDTKVIAGDQCVSDVTLLSRQIMRVTIPGDLAPNTLDGVDYIDVHIATPYGVTSHLHIPYIRKEKPAATAVAATWKWIGATEFEACVNLDLCGNATICTPVIPGVDGLRAVLLDRTLEMPAGGTFAASLALIPLDEAGKELSDGNVLNNLQFQIDGHEQGTYTNLTEAAWNEAVARTLDKQPTAKKIVVRALAGAPRPNKTFDKELVINVKVIPTNLPCTVPPSPTPAPKAAPPAAPAPKAASMPLMRQLSIAAMQPSVVAPTLELAEPSETLPQPIVAPIVPTQTAPPQTAPIFAAPQLPVIALPQSPSTVTTVTQGVPVFGQPVPVPVLVPALPAQPVQQAPAHQRHPCPCKSLRFAVPGEAPVEGVPGEELGSIPMQSLKRMLGWSEPVLHGAPGFLDPDLMPAGYMRPLPATN